MIPKRLHKYLAVFAIVAGLGIWTTGILFGQYVLIYGLCGSFCIIVGGLYLATVKEKK